MLNRYAYVDEIFKALDDATPDEIGEILERNNDNVDLEALIRLAFDYRSYKFEVRKIPNYQRKTAAGVRIAQVLDRMEEVLNSKLISEKVKYKRLVSMLQLLEARDALILERALTGDLNLNFTLEEAQQYFPKLRGLPYLERSIKNIGDFKYSGKLVTVPRNGIPIAIRVNHFHNCKFIDLATGQAMILPDKVHSEIVASFWNFTSVMFFGVFEALTKEGKLSQRERSIKEKFRDFGAGRLEDENFQITICDSTNIQTWENLGVNVPVLTNDFRLRWLQQQEFRSKKLKVAEIENVRNVEGMRELENKLMTSNDPIRYYADTEYFRDGYQVLTKDLF